MRSSPLRACVVLLVAAAAAGPASIERTDGTSGSAPSDREVVVTGRLLLPDGSPADGARLHLYGFYRDDPITDVPAPDGWRSVRAKSGADGRFEVRFVPPASFGFRLRASHGDHVDVQWRWPCLAEAARLALGVERFEEAGALEVRIVLPDGRPAPGDWDLRVEDHRYHRHESGGRVGVRRRGFWTAEMGWSTVAGIAPGRASIRADGPRGAETVVDILPGASVPCELVVDPPEQEPREAEDPFAAERETRIVVRARDRLLGGRHPKEAHVRLIGDSFDESRAFERTGSNDEFELRDVPPGQYTIVVDDPAFEHWERSDVRPGDRLTAELGGSAALTIEVVDATTGSAIQGWTLTLWSLFGEAELRPEEGSPGVIRIDALVPGSYELAIDAPGLPPLWSRADDMAVGEDRRVRVEVDDPETIAGIVVAADERSPVAGATVELYRGRLLRGHFPWWRGWGEEWRTANLIARATTDADGRFRIETLSSAPLVVRAIGGGGLHVVREIGEGADEPLTELSLEMPEPVWLEGTVEARHGAPVEALVALAATWEGVEAMEVEHWDPQWDTFLETSVRADGTFRLGPLGSGIVRFGLVLDDRSVCGGTNGSKLLVERRLEIERAGTIRLDLDLTTIWPGDVECVVLASGEPVGDLVVSFAHPEGFADPTVPLGGGSVATDPDGRAAIRLLAGAYRATVRDEHGLWTWQAEELVVVRPAARLEWVADVPAVRRTLRIVDASIGGPLASERVRVFAPGAPDPLRPRIVSTDSRGLLELTLPPGPIRIERGDRSELDTADALEALARVEWTEDGPIPPVIELP